MSIEIDSTAVAAAVWSKGDAAAFLPSLVALRRAHPDLEINVVVERDWPVEFDQLSVRRLWCLTLPDLVEEVSADWTRHVVLLWEAVIAPPEFLDRAIEAIEDDLRIATVSFLSNAAGSLSVPHRNVQVVHQVESHDEVSITRLLRDLVPAPRVAPILWPAGAVAVLSRYALGACDGLPRLPGSASFQVSDFALTAGRRGYLSVVDAGTYVTRPYDLGEVGLDPIEDPSSDEYDYLLYRHGYLPAACSDVVNQESTPLGLAVSVASAKIRGLRVVIDGSDVGPREMGTQVQILSLARELARRSDVQSVRIGLPGPVPPYAAPFLDSEKLSTFYAPGLDLSAANTADIVHRPSQPSSVIPFDEWRRVGRRVVVTLQDLIAYQVGAYSGHAEQWFAYRNGLVEGAANADGVVVISNDTLRHVRSEALPLDEGRTFVVENGTDHPTGAESGEPPAELTARGFLGEEFLLVLGTNYGHKNRDLAIRAWRLLRYSFPQLALVMVGAYVPRGSSRVLEASASLAAGDQPFVIPDVTSAERNWLMRHARAVLYPTSAEGFGLVPFEAARFDTPAVGVRFGPLGEVNPEADQWAASWRPEDIATTVGQMLSDPSLAAAHVRSTLRSGEQLSWAKTAAGLADVYRTLLSMPARWPNRR